MSVALVTGAHGFLGRHVALELSGHGYEVHGLGHGTWSPEEQHVWGVKSWLRSDVDVTALSCLDVSPSLIIHCAGGSAVSFAEQNPVADFERTVSSTAAVLQTQLRKWPAARLVLTSSAAVYGKALEQPIRETAPLKPVSVYGLHKLLAEQLVHFYADRFGITGAIVRLFSVYGPGLRKQLFWDACGKLAKGDWTFPGTGAETRDWVHVRDAARLLRIAAEVPIEGCVVVNGGTGRGRRVDAVLRMIAGAVAPDGEVAFSGLSRSGDPQHYEAHMGVAHQFGWEPMQDFDSALAQYCAWFSESPRT